ncbi:Mycobacterium numidiamassiliense ORFan [Mycobacterium numidiamassiliense]|uniref:Mycobacterium numidiamassiliense ORFan n=1 Tax=Mycobacterium numidiamassiliense TaxID=1841861 RepID=A0A2U3P8X4_9MYCO|nr:Mycobacterium numidiamassiliense ORFan [Mycobacterium numidiamassiliense]
MPATCEYAFVAVRRCSPRFVGVDGKVTAKLVGLSYPTLGGSGSDPSTVNDPSLR